MIVEIISKYLISNKRLVVPNLGAFIVKKAGESILFSNLMKGDDGVLRGLIMADGVSELEAAGAIGRFVFEVNYRLENSGVCVLNGFGELRSGANGTISFKYDPSLVAEALVGELGAKKVKASTAPEPIEEKVEQPEQSGQPVVESAADEDAELEVVSRVEPREERPRKGVSMDYEPPTVSSKMQPADYVKGLRYGKGRKVVTGREYTSSRKSVKGDRFIMFAIVAAVLAILALLYGFWNDYRASQYDEPIIDNSEIYDEEPASAEREVRNPDLDYIQPYENK